MQLAPVLKDQKPKNEFVACGVRYHFHLTDKPKSIKSMFVPGRGIHNVQVGNGVAEVLPPKRSAKTIERLKRQDKARKKDNK